MFELILKNSIEGLAFLLVSMVIFNQSVQFLQILGLFAQESITYVGALSVLFAANNLLSKKFFNMHLIN